MPRQIHLTPAGVITDPSLVEVPDGALSLAEECVMRRAGILESRKPWRTVLEGLTVPAHTVRALVPFDGVLYAWSYNDSTWKLHEIVPDTSITEVSSLATGDLAPPDYTKDRTRTAAMRGNLYHTSGIGVRKITGTGSQSQESGVRMPPLAPSAAPTTVAGGSAIGAGKWVTWRAVVRRTDANGVITRSVPSPALTGTNGAAETIDVNVTVPIDTASVGVQAGDVVELYRSRNNASALVDPDLFLVAEQEVSAADVSAGEVVIADRVADADLGAAMYANPGQDGSAAVNYPPPLCMDLAEYAGHLFFGDCTAAFRLATRLIAVAGSETHLAGSASTTPIDLDGDLTSGSDQYTNVTSASGVAPSVGQYVWEQATPSALPAGTYITAVSGAGPWTVTLSEDATATIASKNLCRSYGPGIGSWTRVGAVTVGVDTITGLASTTMLRVGMVVHDNVSPTAPTWGGSNYFPAGTKITAVGATSVTLDNDALATSVAAVFGFSDTVTVDGDELYAFPTAGATDGFLISVADNEPLRLDVTARNLVEVSRDNGFAIAEPRGIIEQTWADPLTLTLGSAPEAVDNGWPSGQIVWENRRSSGDGGFTIASSATDAWSPSLDTSGTAATADEHDLYWSKLNEPEHVPLLNHLDVGRKDKRLMRAVAGRDALYLFKEEGIWRLSGVNGNWRVDVVHPTIRLLHPEAVCELDGAVYAWTDRGVIRLVEGGEPVPLSGPLIGVELDDIQKLLVPHPANARGVWMVADPDNDEILLGVPSDDDEEFSVGGAWIFNLGTKAWTHWGRAVFRVAVYDEATSAVYYSRCSGYDVWRHRDDDGISGDGAFDVLALLTAIDDEVIELTVTGGGEGGSGGCWSWRGGADEFEFDEVVIEADAVTTIANVISAQIEVVFPDAIITLTLSGGTGLTDIGDVDALTIHKRILGRVKWRERHGGDPLAMKFFQDGAVRWELPPGQDHSLIWSSDQVVTEQEIVITSSGKVQRFFVPRNYASATALTPEIQACAPWSLLGISLEYERYSEAGKVPL